MGKCCPPTLSITQFCRLSLECSTGRNAYDYMHNWLQHQNRAHGHRRIISNGICRARVHSSVVTGILWKTSTYSQSVRKGTSNVTLTRSPSVMLAMAYPRFPAYEGNNFLNL